MYSLFSDELVKNSIDEQTNNSSSGYAYKIGIIANETRVRITTNTTDELTTSPSMQRNETGTKNVTGTNTESTILPNEQTTPSGKF